MIDLNTHGPTLARFVRDLEAQAPRAFDPTSVDCTQAHPEDLHAAWTGWASRIVDEYRSVVVFTELLGHLAVIAAPFEMLCAVQRLIGDELRHEQLCAQLASVFGPLEGLEIDLEGLGLPPSTEPPALRALTIIGRELVVAEGESIAILKAYRDATGDAGCRAALSTLLQDEARHYATGRALFAQLVRRVDAEAAQGLETVMQADALSIRAAHRRGAMGGPGRRFGVSIEAHEAPPA